MCTSPAAVATLQMLAVTPVAQQLHRDPGALREGAGDPRSLVCRRVARTRQPQRQRAGGIGGQEFLHVGTSQPVAAFFSLPAPARDEPRQASVTGAMARDDHQAQPALEREFRTDEQLDAVNFLRGRVCAHHAGQRALIGYGQRGVSQLPGLRDQFLCMRSAAQKREIADAMELGVRDIHPNTPCRNQRRAPSHSR
jgi:hypothetical protein